MNTFKTFAKAIFSSAAVKHLAAELFLTAASVFLTAAASYFTGTSVDPTIALAGRAAVGFAKRVVDTATAKVNGS